MTNPVWETLLLDAAGTLVTLGVTVAAGWLAHRAGRLAPLYAKLGAWLGANAGTVEADVEKVVEELIARGAVKAAEHPGIVGPPQPFYPGGGPKPGSGAPSGPPGPPFGSPRG